MAVVDKVKKLAILASGNGSNAENIVSYFQNTQHIVIQGIWTNNPDAYVIERAKKLNLDSHVFTREQLNNGFLTTEFRKHNIDYIVLAGFLLKIPSTLLVDFKNKIINIHPSLLPKYGGKGMYGLAVHKAVIEAGDTTSGITIHIVTEEYDEGPMLFQKEITVQKTDSAEELANKIHQLEYIHYPQVIEKYVLNRKI